METEFRDELHGEAEIALALFKSGCHESALPWLTHLLRNDGYTTPIMRQGISTAIERLKLKSPNFWPSDGVELSAYQKYQLGLSRAKQQQHHAR